jgi:pSer/pThr/pTyr-binding forkhead associated (FHA) protein
MPSATIMDSPQQEPRRSALAPGQQLALRFISGKYQGGEFPLTEGVPIIVGRSSDLDMVLVEEMVSRRHARIELRQGVVRVEDLGSTNGTFVNGERINSGSLAEGDRLLIGTSILKLVVVDEQQSGAFTHRPAGSVRATPGKEPVARPTGQNAAVRMTGNLDEIPLPDLMQLLGTSKKSGTLVLHSEKVGQLHLRHGEIIHASIADLRLPALKAAYRMLAWTRGTFALEQEDEKAPTSVHLTAQAFLMEGIRQMDELHNLLTRLPSLDARLGLSTPLRSPLQNLAQPQLEVLQAVISAPDFRAALDRSPRTDLETTQDVLVLLKNGYLEIM